MFQQSDLFTFFITQLQQYLPHTKAELKTDEGKVQRADEIEYVYLVVCVYCVTWNYNSIFDVAPGKKDFQWIVQLKAEIEAMLKALEFV